MKYRNVLCMASYLSATLLTGCNGDSNITTGSTTPTNPPEDGVLVMFGAGSTTPITPYIMSEKDNWSAVEVTATQSNLTSIGAVLINYLGTNDAVDVQIPGNGNATFFLHNDTPFNLSSYSSGYIEFDLRSSMTKPSSLNVSLDNNWPNRSSLNVGSYLITDGNWHTISIPITCLKPVDGAVAVDLGAVNNPFHLSTSENFDYELSKVQFRTTASVAPALNASDCTDTTGSGNDGDTTSGSGVNNAPDLKAEDAAVYYSGNKDSAVDLSQTYVMNSFGGEIIDSEQVISAKFSNGNGGINFGDDNSAENLSDFAAGFITLDLNVSSYGDSSGILLRTDSTTGADYGTSVKLGPDSLPANNNWYRCTIPFNNLVSTNSMRTIQKALFLSGDWDSMTNLTFSMSNLALLKDSPSNYDSNKPCVEIAGQ